MPSETIHLFCLTYLLCAETQTLDDSIHLGRSQEDQQKLHQVAQQVACLELRLFVYVHQHELQLTFHFHVEEVRQRVL